MDVVGTVDGLRARLARGGAANATVGFVPTMGYFHEGHLSLMRAARAECDVVAVSIFVNPLQFGPGEDFEEYPRDLERDLRLATEAGVDVAFTPQASEMYPHGVPETTVDPGPIADRFEGASRPGHFRGVATVVAKLFNVVGPCRAFFGQKDAQQLAVVRRMAADLSFPVEVVGCPIVREADGLAMSSRNVFLAGDERVAATSLHRGLSRAREEFARGERAAARLAAVVTVEVAAEPLAELDYVAVVDEEVFEQVEAVTRPARMLVAARVGRPRLIDNMLLQAWDRMES